jgi:hypothetical protein
LLAVVNLQVLEFVTYILGIRQAWVLVFGTYSQQNFKTLRISGAMEVYHDVTIFCVIPFVEYMTG